MPQLLIDRLPADRAPSAFLDDYYARERPVIIEGVRVPQGIAALLDSRTALRDIIACEDARELNPHSPDWLDLTSDVLSKQYGDPAFDAFLAGLLPKAGVSFRRTWIRLFGHETGHVTSWHYDGNGIHNLNLCVRGRKYWQIVSPQTPLVHLPFIVGAFQGHMPLTERQRERLDWMDFECREGDLVFIPRGWSHTVISLDPWNANITWVFTPHEETTSTPVGRREMASVLALDWLRRPAVYRLLPHWAQTAVDVESGDEEFAARLASFRGRADFRQVAADVATELRRVPLAFAAYLLYRALPEAKPRER